MSNTKEPKVITDFDACPHCGSNYGYFTRVKSKGTWNDTTMFDHTTKENTEMMDSFIDTWESKKVYCSQCKKAICNRSL